jgi:hypothetical protein
MVSANPRRRAALPVRQEVDFLRDRALRLRKIARIDSALSAELIEIADALDARANELEQAGGLTSATSQDRP